jgi:excisionase family DNA binding protein
MSEHLLTTQEAAERLGASRRTLEDWRLRGNGPVYRKLGKRLVRYSLPGLEAFVSRGARANTGDASDP